MSNQFLYNNCIDNLTYYHFKTPIKDTLVYAKLLKYNDDYILCYLPEFKKNAKLYYKQLTNIKKIYVIKKKFKSVDNLILKTISDNENYIELSKKNLDQESENNFISFYNLYTKIWKIFIQCYIWYYNCSQEKNINLVERFLKESLWKLDINMYNYSKYINLFYKDKNYFSSCIPNSMISTNQLKFNIKTSLTSFIKDPEFLIKIYFTINSYHLNAIKEIIKFVNNLSESINLKIKFIETPNFAIIETKQFENDLIAENYLQNIVKKINEFDYDKSTIVINIYNYSAKLI